MNARENRLVQLAVKGRILTPVSPGEVETGSWTEFQDVWAGGCAKEPWDQIFIQAAPTVACHVFEHVFEHDPLNISCTCCGSEYVVTQAQFVDYEHSLFIKADDILPEWKEPKFLVAEIWGKSVFDKENLGGFAKMLAKIGAGQPVTAAETAELHQLQPYATTPNGHLVTLENIKTEDFSQLGLPIPPFYKHLPPFYKHWVDAPTKPFKKKKS